MINKPQGQLIRSLGLFSAFILTVSSVIGSGMYKKVAIMSGELLSPQLVLLCWVLAGLISLCGALSNAEIASMLVDSGGEYVYYRKIYNKFFAFLYGWTAFTVIRSASLASISYVFAQSFNTLIPLPQLPASVADINLLGIFTPFDNFGVKALTIALIAGLSYVNYRGMRGGEGLSRIILILVTATIGLTIVLGLTIGGGSFQNIQNDAVGFVHRPWWDGDLLKAIFVSMLASFWAYEGWATTGYIGGEIKNPNRNLPLALVFGVLFVIVVYVSVNFTYLYVLPIDQMVAVNKSPNGIAAVEVLRSFLGGGGALFISVLILFTTFGAANTTALMPPRLYYSMAREGMFFKSAAYIHPTYNTPSKAFLIQAVWTSLLVLSGSFDQLTDMLVFASFIFYGATTLGVFILRYKMPDAPRPYRAWGYPILPVVFILFCLALIGMTLISRPREALLGLGLMLSGVPFYLYWNRSPK
jgi:APA family basic amino acid/polyamine antiporter